MDMRVAGSLVRAYVKDNFVDKGMCADFAIHAVSYTHLDVYKRQVVKRLLHLNLKLKQ